MSDHTRSSRTQASTLVSLPSTSPPARISFDGAALLHENTKGTQGPGHFTVQPCGPHYRAHPLRFCGFAESLKGRTGDSGDTGDTGARVNARRTSRCPSGESLFPARTRVRAKPDGLTPVALRAKRPLIAPSRPSSSRLVDYRVVLWHVADVPGVQGQVEAWKFRGLEAWLSSALFHRAS